MKKIVFVWLIALLFFGCGKVEKGSITIENKSTHEVDIEFAQNYSSEFIKLQSGDSISCSWERYFHCIIEKPSTNILKRQQTKEKITILNNDNLCTYTVRNGIPDLTMLEMIDETKSILAQPDGTPTNSITLNPGVSTVNNFVPLSIKNIVFNKGTPFTVAGHSYYPIEKKGEFYYFNQLKAGKLETKKINIDFIGNEIIITN